MSINFVNKFVNKYINKYISKFESKLKPILNILRLTLFIILFIAGFLTIFMFFFSFIGILIGLGFFIFSKNIGWKTNGVVLAFSATISTWVTGLGIELAPLKLASFTGPIIVVIYLLTRLSLEMLVKKKKLNFSKIKLKYTYSKPVIKKVINAVVITFVIVLPIYIWGSTSINFGVLTDNSPQILWVHCPTTVDIGKPFKVVVQCWDPYERLSATYNGTVSFEIESYNFSTLSLIKSPSANLPSSYTFTGQKYGSSIAYLINDGKDNGKKEFLATIYTPGIHYIKVKDSLSKKVYYSNPIVVDRFSASDYKIYWGDIHTHSSLSDGSGTLEHNAIYAKEVACIDFMGFTDHSEILMWKPGIFKKIEKKINDLNKDGQFVVFQGFEWTQVADGHYSIIFSGDKLLKNVNYLNTPKPQDLWKKLDEFTYNTGCKALALPHHSTKKEYVQDWTYVNEKYVKIAEVSSTHGSFLFEPWDKLNYLGSVNPPKKPQNGTCVIDAINMGYKLSLYTASDCHDGFPGHTHSHTGAYVGHQRPFTIWHARNEKPYCGGITAVYSKALTRQDIFNGLYNQKIYSSSDYSRPYIFFSINGVNIIENNNLVLSSIYEERKLKIILAQDGAYTPQKLQNPINVQKFYNSWNAKIEIIKNGEIFKSIPVNGPVKLVEIIDFLPIQGAEYGYSKCIKKDEKYYINEYSDNPIEPSMLNTKGADYYIIRIVTDFGREAYIGPFWVTALDS